MKKPDPEVGQIVKFDYLWRAERLQGRVDGAKDRPCAVVLARRQQDDGSFIVLLAPITHSAPEASTVSIAIPSQSSKATGLDNAQSWLILSEVNLVPWSDAGIVPAHKSQWLYGYLPRKVATRATEEVGKMLRKAVLGIVKRG